MCIPIRSRHRWTVERLCDAVIGHAVGDALGVPVEGCLRVHLDGHPVEGMRGFGTYDVPAGAWSDDTGMVLATMAALQVPGADGRVDYTRMMECFCDWRYKGAYTATGAVFDCGTTVNTALYRYRYEQTEPLLCGSYDENTISNGSLMRILPVVLYALYRGSAFDEVMDLVANVSRLTHAHPRVILGCRIYAVVLREIWMRPSRASVARGLKLAAKSFSGDPEWSHYERLCRRDFAKTPMAEIEAGGYVVQSLEAAMYCLLTTSDYRSCVLRAVNMGRDTDTVAAIAGGLAGALYGREQIPAAWQDTLIKREELLRACVDADAAWRARRS